MMGQPICAKDIAETTLMSDNGKGVKDILDAVDGVDPDNGKPSELASALAECLRRLIKPRNARASSLRFLGLVHHLAPDLIGQSLTSSAKQLKVTKAALSKTALSILDEFRIPGRYHKSQKAREAYKQSQLKSVRLGRHASQVRKIRKKQEVAVDTNGNGNEGATRSPQPYQPCPQAETPCFQGNSSKLD